MSILTLRKREGTCIVVGAAYPAVHLLNTALHSPSAGTSHRTVLAGVHPFLEYLVSRKQNASSSIGL